MQVSTHVTGELRQLTKPIYITIFLDVTPCGLVETCFFYVR